MRAPGRRLAVPLAAALAAALALTLGTLGTSPEADAAPNPQVDCANFTSMLAPGSLAARTMASYCGVVPAVASAGPMPVIHEAGPDLAALEREIRSAVDDYWVDGNYAVAVTDLQTGETIEVNGNRRQLAGCSINFFVMLQTMIERERGALTAAETDTLLRTTVHFSDPVAARQLYTMIGDGSLRAGVKETRDLVRALGLKSTVLDHAPLFLDAASLGSSDNFLTAADANRALAQLWWGGVLPEASRDKLLDTMSDVKPGLNYLTGYGTGGVVSHKNGFFPVPAGGWWVDNDIGLVRFERDGVTYAYAISFLSERVPEKYGSLSLFRPISELVWDYFDRTYP
ncbi:MAG: serine hydrolase [Dehalococcoidia bacterium]